jgi:LacI family transcriptional regulator
MGRFLARKGQVMVVTGQLSTIDHAQKVAGFRQALAEMWPSSGSHAVVEAHDHEPEAYEKCRKLLPRRPTSRAST